MISVCWAIRWQHELLHVTDVQRGTQWEILHYDAESRLSRPASPAWSWHQALRPCRPKRHRPRRSTTWPWVIRIRLARAQDLSTSDTRAIEPLGAMLTS